MRRSEIVHQVEVGRVCQRDFEGPVVRREREVYNSAAVAVGEGARLTDFGLADCGFGRRGRDGWLI